MRRNERPRSRVCSVPRIRIFEVLSHYELYLALHFIVIDLFALLERQSVAGLERFLQVLETFVNLDHFLLRQNASQLVEGLVQLIVFDEYSSWYEL